MGQFPARHPGATGTGHLYKPTFLPSGMRKRESSNLQLLGDLHWLAPGAL